MPPEVWIIMGDSNTKKSATIRALTGAFRKNHYDISTTKGILRNVYIEIRSLQEAKIEPKEFISKHNNDKFILLSLWINSSNRYPDGIDYINEFIRNRWIIKEIVVLGRNQNNMPYKLPTNVSVRYIPNTNIPANKIAHEIRNWWNWL